MLNLDKINKDLEELRKIVCNNYSYWHFDCPCSTDECYGDFCSIEQLEEEIFLNRGE